MMVLPFPILDITNGSFLAKTSPPLLPPLYPCIFVLPYVLNITSTTEVWQMLLKQLQATNCSRVIQLKTELNRVSLKNNSITHFLSKVKSLVDQIAVAGSHIDSEDVILHILNGLPPSYQAFKTAIRTRASTLDLDDLYSFLLSEEINLANEVTKELQLSQHPLYTPRGRGRSFPSRGRSRQTAGFGSSIPFNRTLAPSSS